MHPTQSLLPLGSASSQVASDGSQPDGPLPPLSPPSGQPEHVLLKLQQYKQKSPPSPPPEPFSPQQQALGTKNIFNKLHQLGLERKKSNYRFYKLTRL